MATKADEYRAVLEILKGRHDVSGFANKLAKIWAQTEDSELRVRVHEVCEHLKTAALSMPKKNQSLKSSLRITNPPYKALAEYCVACINLRRPQWQLLAERNGWTPPPRR